MKQVGSRIGELENIGFKNLYGIPYLLLKPFKKPEAVAIFSTNQNAPALFHMIRAAHYKLNDNIIGFIGHPELPISREVTGITDDGSSFYRNINLYGMDDLETLTSKQSLSVLLPTGKITKKWEAVKEMERYNINFPSLVLPFNNVVPDSIERGVIICKSNTFYPGSTIDEFSFILDNNFIGHNAQIGKNVYISTFCHIGHYVKIGDHTKLNARVTIDNKVEIGENCTIGTGVRIKSDVPPHSYVSGNPAKINPK